MTITEHKADITGAVICIVNGLNTNGAHHKQHDLWIALRALVGDKKADIIANRDGFDKGVPE